MSPVYLNLDKDVAVVGVLPYCLVGNLEGRALLGLEFYPVGHLEYAVVRCLFELHDHRLVGVIGDSLLKGI